MRRISPEDVGAGECRDHRTGRTAQQLVGRGELHQAAIVDYPHTLSQGGRVVEGVGDQQSGKPELGENVGEHVAHLPARDRVERAERLVEQQHTGLARESACQRHPLTLAT